VKLDHIVVASDLTPAAEHCYPHAAYLASSAGHALITLLHVQPDAANPPGAVPVEDIPYAITSDANTLRLEGADRVETAIKIGDATTEVNRFVESASVDLVIVAKHSGPIARALKLGSTAKRIMRTSSVPVLVVHKTDGPPQPPAHFVLGVDHTERSDRLIDEVMSLAQALAGKVTLVTVAEPGADPKELVDALEAKRAAYPDQETDARVVPSKNIEAALRQTAVEVEASMIAVAASGKGLLDRLLVGSTSDELADEAAIPVLVMPDEQDEE